MAETSIMQLWCFRAQHELYFVFQTGDFKVGFRRKRRWLKVVFSRWAVYSNSIDQVCFTPLRTARYITLVHITAHCAKYRSVSKQCPPQFITLVHTFPDVQERYLFHSFTLHLMTLYLYSSKCACTK